MRIDEDMAELDAELEAARKKRNGNGADSQVSPPGEPMPNMRRFLADKYDHPDRYLLIHQGGQFYSWDGTCWPTVEDAALVSALYKWFEHKHYVTGKGELKPYAPTVRKVFDLVGAAKGITNLLAKVETPSWLGKADCPADEVISCENGLVHWPTRKLLPHRPGYYVHHSVPFAFDPAAAMPERWQNFGLQDLIGKPVALVSDARIGGKADVALIAERLLSISGQDLQNVDRKYLEPWSGYLPTRFVILTNELPRFTDASGALAGRFVVLMLTQSFYGKENPALTDELCSELPAIFNWALDGLQKLRARGRFEQPAASKQAIQEMEDLASPVGAFVRDRCTLGPQHSIETQKLYQTYQQWCLDTGTKAANFATFGRDLRAVCPEIKVSRLGGRGHRTATYVGVSMGGRYGTYGTESTEVEE